MNIEVLKKVICFYLCVTVCLLGTVTLLPANADARMIKKTASFQQITLKEMGHYHEKDNSKIETMSAGETTASTSKAIKVFLFLGILVIAATYAMS